MVQPSRILTRLQQEAGVVLFVWLVCVGFGPCTRARSLSRQQFKKKFLQKKIEPLQHLPAQPRLHLSQTLTLASLPHPSDLSQEHQVSTVTMGFADLLSDAGLAGMYLPTLATPPHGSIANLTPVLNSWLTTRSYINGYGSSVLRIYMITLPSPAPKHTRSGFMMRNIGPCFRADSRPADDDPTMHSLQL